MEFWKWSTPPACYLRQQIPIPKNVCVYYLFPRLYLPGLVSVCLTICKAQEHLCVCMCVCVCVNVRKRILGVGVYGMCISVNVGINVCLRCVCVCLLANICAYMPNYLSNMYNNISWCYCHPGPQVLVAETRPVKDRINYNLNFSAPHPHGDGVCRLMRHVSTCKTYLPRPGWNYFSHNSQAL